MDRKITMTGTQSCVDVLVCIVNYNKSERLKQCVASIRRQISRWTIAISLVDNSDREPERSEAATLRGVVDVFQGNAVNTGYSRAVNQAARAGGRFRHLILCSPDIILDDPTTINTLIERLEQSPRIGALACIQVDDAGHVVEVERHFPTLWRQVARRLFRHRFREVTASRQVDQFPGHLDWPVHWVQSSFVAVPWSAWQRIGGLDEAYAIFMADTQMSRDLRRAGLETWITARSSARSDGRRASTGAFGAILTSRTQRIHIRDALVYYCRNLMLRS